MFSDKDYKSEAPSHNPRVYTLFEKSREWSSRCFGLISGYRGLGVDWDESSVPLPSYSMNCGE